jgi:hypothetical protein
MNEMNSGRVVYGMNRGSVGFLMNDYSDADLSDGSMRQWKTPSGRWR